MSNVISFPERRPFTTNIKREPIARNGRQVRLEVVGDRIGIANEGPDQRVLIEMLAQRKHVPAIGAVVRSIRSAEPRLGMDVVADKHAKESPDQWVVVELGWMRRKHLPAIEAVALSLAS